MKKTTIYLVRHGESLGNRLRVCLGHTDWDLTDLGRAQARDCAEALASVKLDAIYASDLLRAFNTALPHAELRGVSVIPTPEFRELGFGKWECVPLDTIKTEYKNEYLVDWKEHFYSFRAPLGESVPELRLRVRKKLVELAERHAGGTILVGTHAAVIRAFYTEALGLTEEEVNASSFPTNASYSVVEYDGERFIPVAYSVSDHQKSSTAWGL